MGGERFIVWHVHATESLNLLLYHSGAPAPALSFAAHCRPCRKRCSRENGATPRREDNHPHQTAHTTVAMLLAFRGCAVPLALSKHISPAPCTRKSRVITRRYKHSHSSSQCMDSSSPTRPFLTVLPIGSWNAACRAPLHGLKKESQLNVTRKQQTNGHSLDIERSVRHHVEKVFFF